jgi:hypothetical protein
MAKGFGRPAMCASSVEPFSVERGSTSWLRKEIESREPEDRQELRNR